MRLIDADALVKEITEFRCVNCDRRKGMKKGKMTFVYEIGDVPCRACDVMDMIDVLDEAPTVGGWISVKDRLPEEHESIFHKFLGTPKWSSAMWQQESDKVLVYVSFPDGTGVVTTGCLHNSDWMTTVSKTLPQTVTHWMPLPSTEGLDET